LDSSLHTRIKTAVKNGQKLVVQSKRRQSHFHQQESSWRQCFGMLKAFVLRNAHKEVGSLKVGFKPHTNLCRGTNKEILSTEGEINTMYYTYFHALLTTSVRADQSNPLEATYLNQADMEEEREEEFPGILDIEMAIKSINKKSRGIDHIPAELYKKRELLLNKIHSLIKEIWCEEKMSTDWTTSIIVPIYGNRGDKLQWKNYREISLLCAGFKMV